MTPDPPSLEAELRDLHAVALDESFLTRLEASADGTWTALTQQEVRFETLLRGTRPAKLDSTFLASLENIVRDMPFDSDEKIVPFPKAAATATVRRPRPIWGAAAAVALIGAAAALLMPANKPSADITRQPVSSAPLASSANARNFVPASFNRDVSEVHDEGFIWKSNNQPHSVVRVVYKDRVLYKDSNGRTVQVDQPRIQYMLVPAKTD